MRLNILTIVLDGQPWLPMQYALFLQLKCDWHWYIVEGVAENIACTKWCKPIEPRLSNDGTTEYIETLKSDPRVTVLQKPSWAGKIEMVNAPLALIRESGVLLQVDADEFHTVEGLDSLVNRFEVQKPLQRLQFPCDYFVGPSIVARDPKPVLWMRAWRFAPGDLFTKHEPPILVGTKGLTDTASYAFAHMSYVLERQVAFKEEYYGYTGAVEQWERLQANTEWPVQRLTDFLPWAGKNSSAHLFLPPAPNHATILSEMPTLDSILEANKPQLPSVKATPVVPPPVSASQAYKNRAGPFPRPAVRRFLLVINFYDGDREQATELAMLIHDLQKERSADTDILFYHRNDSSPMDAYVVEKMRTKFLKVFTLKCSRLNGRGHPYGCNEMWYALIELMRTPKWTQDYYAFFNLEPDCTPLHPNWIKTVAAEFRQHHADGYQAVGHIKNAPSTHLNGAAIYATDFYNHAGGLNLLGGPTTVGYDLHHALRILPVSSDTPLIGGRWGLATVPEAELWAYEKVKGIECVLFHGGKDGSPRAAVRKKWLGGK